MRIMLVDDEEDILRSVGGLLVDFGHEVIPARDGAEALGLLEGREGIGLIVSDIEMPGGDGIDLLRSVRARWTGVPVILMTGHGDDDRTVAAFHSGAYDYVKKPIRLRDLLTCVERVEEEGRLAAQLLRGRQGLMQGQPASAGTILAGVAYEVQSPLAAAMGHLQSLDTFWKVVRSALGASLPEDPVERRTLEFILREMPGLLSDARRRLGRIAEVVRDVGAFVRQEGGGRRPVNLIGCLKEAVEAARSPASGGATFAESYDAEVVRVSANRQDLHRAFSHLLNNAAQAAQGREAPLVRVTARVKAGNGEAEKRRNGETENKETKTRRHGDVENPPLSPSPPLPVGDEGGGWVEVAVEDNGPGVPAEIQARVFDPFFTTRPVGEGLGLGLAICLGIVREHGGEMGFEAREGAGARFWVRLPVAKEED